MQMLTELTLKKSTKVTHVYENLARKFPGIYVPKVFFSALEQNDPPRKLYLTLQSNAPEGWPE